MQIIILKLCEHLFRFNHANMLLDTNSVHLSITHGHNIHLGKKNFRRTKTTKVLKIFLASSQADITSKLPNATQRKVTIS